MTKPVRQLERILPTIIDMKSLLVTFLALSLVLGPLQELSIASSVNNPELERVFLVSLLNRTRLFEIINKSLFQVQNNCLYNPFYSPYVSLVSVKKTGNCPAIVNRMLEQIKVNYPGIRKLYVVYNLLRNSKHLLDTLTQAEGYKFGDGPMRIPLGEAASAYYYSRELERGPTQLSLSDVRFKSPFPGVTQAWLNGFYVHKIQPADNDFQQAAAEMPFIITEPCASGGGLCPSAYDMSVTGFFKKACHDYVEANAAQKMSAADRYARWPAHPEDICNDFRLAFNRQTRKFSFVLSDPSRNSTDPTLKRERRTLFRDVVNAGIMAREKNMVAYARARLFALVSTAPYVALVGSSRPSLMDLKKAIRSVADQATKNANKFEKLFVKLQKNPNDRKGYLNLLDRSPIVQNLLRYPSPDMQQEANVSVFQQIAKGLIKEHQRDESFHNDWVNAAWLVLPVVATYGCRLLGEAAPETYPVCAGTVFLTTTAFASWQVWDDYVDFNEVFGEVFSSMQIGTADANALKQSPALARIDSSVNDPNFEVRNLVLRSLDDLDAAHSAELWQTIFVAGGTAWSAAAETRSILNILEMDPEMQRVHFRDENAGLRKIASFLARLNPLHLRPAAQ